MSLKEIRSSALEDCHSLRAVYVHDRCGTIFSTVMLPPSVRIFPLPETMAGTERVWSLR